MSLFVDIEKNFGDFDLKIKFETNQNVASFLGASGSGKSVTLKCIAGIITPDRGKIILNGRTLFDSEHKINVRIQDRNVGYFFQDYALFPNMNVRKNIILGMKKYGKEFDQESKLNEVSKMLGIESLLEHYPNQLSGGQKQRVALARILVNNPEIILFDEPFSALDEFLRTRLQMEMKETLQNLNKEAIIVTHNRDEAYMLTNQTILIDKGTVVESSGTKELFANPKYLESAILTGCKNYAKAEIRDDEVFVPEWGISFSNIKDIEKDIKYVGIRAHRFYEDKHGYDIEIIDVIEQPFENLIRFRFKNQVRNGPPIYWLVSKDDKKVVSATKINVDPKDIMLLK